MQDFAEKLNKIQKLNFQWINQQNFVFSKKFNNQIFILGESPGKEENLKQEPFTGKSGLFLKNILIKHNLLQDCYLTNILNFQPPNNRKPTIKELNLMKPLILEHIELINPNYILLLGNSSKYILKNDNLKIKIFENIHPSYALRFNKTELFENNIINLKNHINIIKQ